MNDLNAKISKNSKNSKISKKIFFDKLVIGTVFINNV